MLCWNEELGGAIGCTLVIKEVLLDAGLRAAFPEGQPDLG